MHHLIRRFISFVRAKPLTPSEQAWVAEVLNPSLRPLFFAQPYQDQRHAYEVATRVEPALVEAALLHDVGKTASHLGAVSRSLATIWDLASLPLTGRWRRYRDHGTIGATMLEAASASPLTVAFAKGHPGPVPSGIDPTSWHALAESDDA